MLRMRSSSGISSTHLPYVPRTSPTQGKVQLMALTDLLLAREKSAENAHVAPSPVGEGTTSRKRLMERGRSQHHVCDEIFRGRYGGARGTDAARSMPELWKAEPSRNVKAGLEKENPRTMRRNTDLCLGQELTYRTQQRIVRRAALDGHRLEDRSRISGACGRLLRSERCRSRRGLYRYLPGVLHSKGKLDQEGEQTEQSPSAIRCLAPSPVGS